MKPTPSAVREERTRNERMNRGGNVMLGDMRREGSWNRYGTRKDYALMAHSSWQGGDCGARILIQR